MAGLDVDPDVLNSAGRAVTDSGDSLADAVATLENALASSDAMSGHDAAGMVFAQSYSRNGQALLDAAAAGINALHNVGFGISMSAVNYSRAEAASVPGGGQPLSAPNQSSEVDSSAMPRPYGDGVAEPFLWSVVERFVGDFWPDGDPSRLRAAADAWRTFGTSITGMADLPGARSNITAQEMPEAAAMLTSVDGLGQNLTALAAQAQQTAGQLESFAAEVESTQDAIRDLLHRLSLSGVMESLGALFSGENPWDEIRKVAADIETVQANMKRQADADDAIFQQGMGALDGLINSGMEATRKQFVDWMGEDVGNAAAFVVNAPFDLQYGVAKTAINSAHGLEQLNPQRLNYDTENYLGTLGEIAKTASPLALPFVVEDVVSDPQGAFDTFKDRIHYDDFTNGHPFRGVGDVAFDVGSAVVPAGGASKATTVAGAEARAAAGAESRAAGSAIGDAATASARAAGSDIASSAGKIADNFDGVKVAEAAGTPSAGPGPSIVPESRAPVDLPPRTDAPAHHGDPGVPRSNIEVPPPHTRSDGPLASPESRTPSLHEQPGSPPPVAADSAPRPPDQTSAPERTSEPAPGPVQSPAPFAPEHSAPSPVSGPLDTPPPTASSPGSIDTPSTAPPPESPGPIASEHPDPSHPADPSPTAGGHGDPPTTPHAANGSGPHADGPLHNNGDSAQAGAHPSDAHQPLHPQPDRFDPDRGQHYSSGDPHRPGDYPPHTPTATHHPGDTNPGWEDKTRSERGMAYQEQITGIERTADGRIPEWVETNPETGRPVAYDGHTYRGDQEVFLEAKDGYEAIATSPGKPWAEGMAQTVLDEAERQLAALPDGSILEMHVSNSYGANAIRDLLAREGYFDIVVIYTPKL